MFKKSKKTIVPSFVVVDVVDGVVAVVVDVLVLDVVVVAVNEIHDALQ